LYVVKRRQAPCYSKYAQGGGMVRLSESDIKCSIDRAAGSAPWMNPFSRADSIVPR